MAVPILAPDPDTIARCAALLRAGLLIGLPTETVYGLAADARNADAVAAIYAAKGRPAGNPLIVHCAEAGAALDTIARPCAVARALAAAFWPGPMTLIVPRADAARLAPAVTAGLATIAVRVPAHPVARALLSAVGGPVAAPSANRSGRLSPTRASDVATELGDAVAAILDGGTAELGLESTILRPGPGRVSILREGAITADAVVAATGLPVDRDTTPGAIAAPGQLARHYAPGLPVRLDVRAPQPDAVLVGFGAVAGDVMLSAEGDLSQAAQRLFTTLRAAEQLARHSGRAAIAVAPIPQDGLGAAIGDRLRRAAASG